MAELDKPEGQAELSGEGRHGAGIKCSLERINQGVDKPAMREGRGGEAWR